MSDTEKRLGKIHSVFFGLGGYQEAQLGFGFELRGESWGVTDFWGEWAEHNEYCHWTVEDQTRAFARNCRRLHEVLVDAKENHLDQLKNKPVEVTFDGMALKSWRILKEVL